MQNIFRILKKGIINNNWFKVEYKNKDDQITNYLIGINMIYVTSSHDGDGSIHMIEAEAFNQSYNHDCIKISLVLERIQKIEICEYTYYKSNEALLSVILGDALFNEKYGVNFSPNDVLDYYLDCVRLDKVPYIPKYSLISGLDEQVLIIDESFKLSNEQFIELLNKEKYLSEENSRRSAKGMMELNIELAMNIISINVPNKGLYVLAYRPLKLDILNKKLVICGNVTVNHEFSFDKDTTDVSARASISKFISEDDLYLLEDVNSNKELILDAIRQYNKTKYASYNNEVKTDSRPFILNIAKNMYSEINNEFSKIKELIDNPNEMTKPLNVFFGKTDEKLSRKTKSPIFVVDDKYDIDQINAIHIAMRSPVSYIQGPPGTGKTKTIINTIFTSVFNNKTVLVTSNNNIPMDGVYNDIINMKYSNYPLLFPVLRLGNSEFINSALDRIKEMYNMASNLKPDESKINEIKKQRKADVSSLVDMLEQHEKIVELENLREKLLNNIEHLKDEMLKVRTNVEIEEINNQLKLMDKVDLESFKELMKIDFKNFYMAIHYETANRLQQLNKSRYKPILDIVNISSDTPEDKKKRVLAFKEYLSNDTNFASFLEIFPVIISTNLSCTYLGKSKEQFDIVMMDEAGQCNIAYSLIPIFKAKKLMLVGDPQQLKPIVVMDKNINNELMEKYNIPDEYNYIDNSIYTLYTTIDSSNTESLLGYHYRCNDKIIAFPNRKYYNNKLKIKTISKEEEPLIFVDTSKDDRYDNLYEKNISRVEADYILKYVSSHKDEEIGIITPFVKQKEYIIDVLTQNGVDISKLSIGTVHAYQGNQRNTIIFSSAITYKTHQKTYDWLKNNKELINVAVSRAINKFIMLGNKKMIDELSSENNDLKELSEYILTKGKSTVTNSSVSSYALGTRQISSESEIDFKSTINHVLSVIDNSCYIKEHVNISDIFEEEKYNNKLFNSEKFDVVIYQKTVEKNIPIMILELKGPEHLTEEQMLYREIDKKKLCEENNITYRTIPRDCARDYIMIKKSIKKIIKVQK